MEKRKNLKQNNGADKALKTEANSEFAAPNATKQEEHRKEHYKKSVKKHHEKDESNKEE
ncbi:MAG TPA: hypothetical protein VJ970_01685 [Flavobacteriaceae bacterium]|nr:hypothetical protein [Flavobacteriaceae bacterium]